MGLERKIPLFCENVKKRPGGKQQRQLRHETCMGTFMGKSTKIKKKILNKSQLS